MNELTQASGGGYRYLPGVFQYSAAVIADAEFEIERARFRQPVPLSDGFRIVEKHCAAVGRPLLALCACELRSPEPFTEAGFLKFNREYGHWLARPIEGTIKYHPEASGEGSDQS